MEVFWGNFFNSFWSEASTDCKKTLKYETLVEERHMFHLEPGGSGPMVFDIMKDDATFPNVPTEVVNTYNKK